MFDNYHWVDEDYHWDDDDGIPNPNLFITATEVVGESYLLREEGGIILRENGEYLFRT